MTQGKIGFNKAGAAKVRFACSIEVSLALLSPLGLVAKGHTHQSHHLSHSQHQKSDAVITAEIK